MDICGELRGVPHHQRFLIVAYDLYSKWPEAVSTGSVTTQAVIDFLEVLFARWGMPTTITTDNGPQFISAEFTTFLSERGIKHIAEGFQLNSQQHSCGPCCTTELLNTLQRTAHQHV